jgi:hypothetical protein
MLARILLLCDEVERPFLTDTLRAGAPEMEVRHLADPKALAGVDGGDLADARLVTFGVNQALPSSAIAALGHGGYNFHPGPPAYPGWVPSAFAVYDGATEFGATAHALSATTDGGVIVAVDTFPVAGGTTRTELARRAYLSMLSLFRRLAPALVTRPQALPTLPIAWAPRRGTRALYADLCDIPLDIDKPELLRRINGLGGGDGYSVPTVWLHGVPFRFTPEGTEEI